MLTNRVSVRLKDMRILVIEFHLFTEQVSAASSLALLIVSPGKLNHSRMKRIHLKATRTVFQHIPPTY